MSNPVCELYPQLTFDLDLLEVQEGKCFKISQQKFIDSPFTQKDFRKILPRMFVLYDSTSPPEPKYFKDAILNSFPDDDVRANFLNKFYQCLMVGRMPHKVRKLVVRGPKDSGETSWFQVFLGIIPIRYVASITQEKQFSTSMLKPDTQIVFLDEWSVCSLQFAICGLRFAVRHGESSSARRLHAKVYQTQRSYLCFEYLTILHNHE